MENQINTPRVKTDGEKHCSECGAIIRIKAEICPQCGVRQLTMSNAALGSAEPRNKTTAAILAIFLGGLGAHKFYLGKPWVAIVYIAFCWTFIPSLVALVEGVVYLSMSEAKFAAKYPAFD